MAADGRRLSGGRAARVLAGLRLALAVAGVAAPGPFLRLLGVDASRQPASPYLVRLFAVRNAFLAAHLLSAAPGAVRSQAWVDLADAAAAAVALRRGQLTARRAALAVPAGLVAAGLAVTATGDADGPNRC